MEDEVVVEEAADVVLVDVDEVAAVMVEDPVDSAVVVDDPGSVIAVTGSDSVSPTFAVFAQAVAARIVTSIPATQNLRL
ncbi:MAG: hypothetical protein U9R51_08730 [Actinomycetota bacterium]|nr:hypothetical protein [Actinomycetota bacterium]